MSAIEYTFVEVNACNMCGTATTEARVLGKRMNRSQGVRPVSRIGIATTVMKCRDCELVFSNPLPVPHDIAQHYGTPPESYWVPSEFVLDPQHFSREISRYFDLSGSSSGVGLLALDIGAGLGKSIKALERAGFDTYGIEPSEPFRERALSMMQISPDRLQLATLEDAKLPRDSFDFITFGAVLEHLYDPSASIAHALQLAKPGGLVHIEVPSSKWLTNKISNFAYAIQGLDYISNLSPMHSPFHLYEFGLKSFQANAIRSNYQIAHHEYLVCQTYLPRAVDFLVKPFMAATNTGMQLEIWLRKPSAK